MLEELFPFSASLSRGNVVVEVKSCAQRRQHISCVEQLTRQTDKRTGARAGQPSEVELGKRLEERAERERKSSNEPARFEYI